VITNIGQSHLENLGTRDGILKAKTEMFEFRNPEGPIFLNGDDDKLITVKDVAGTIPKFYGFNESNYAHVKNVVSRGLNGTDMTVVLGDREFDAGISMIGNHNVANACVAAAIGEYFGMSTDAIVKGLKDASTIAGRSNLIALKNGFLIDDCYNAAPTSMRAAIDTLCLGEGKRVAILGDMFELGSDEAAMHREIGEYAAGKPVDTIVCVGELSYNTYEGALGGNCGDVRYFKTLDEVLESIDDIVRDAGVILVKASNGMHFSKITEKITLIMSKEENGNVAGHF
jgi:UDP-N-acetylmuramoyl-tripeptide--D-alanyl-D-alanine ligase